MREKPQAVLVLGLREQEHEIEFVQALGYSILLFGTNIRIDDALSADVPVEIDLNDEDHVIATALTLTQRFDIRGVYTLNEYRTPLAARIAAALKLSHGLSHEAALNCRHKKRTRQVLAQHAVGSARFALINTHQEALAALRDFSFPVIIKPSNEAGSHLVACCTTQQEVLQAIDAIQASSTNWVGQSLDPEILLEEYLDGPEVSVEAYTAAGHTTVLAITAKQVTPWPFTTEVGHLVPANLPDTTTAAIHEVVVRALSALGINDTVTHTEVKLTSAGPRIIEVNARPGGDKIPLLVRAVTGYDLREVSLHLALGRAASDLPRYPIAASSAAIRFLVAEQNGTVEIGDPEEIAMLPGVQAVEISVQTGDQVEQTSSNYNRVGYVLVHGTPQQSASERLVQVLDRLAFHVESPDISIDDPVKTRS